MALRNSNPAGQVQSPRLLTEESIGNFSDFLDKEAVSPAATNIEFDLACIGSTSLPEGAIELAVSGLSKDLKPK